MSNLINGATQEMVQAVKNNVTDIIDGTTIVYHFVFVYKKRR